MVLIHYNAQLTSDDRLQMYKIPPTFAKFPPSFTFVEIFCLFNTLADSKIPCIAAVCVYEANLYFLF